jgi:AraC family transcriptional regulator
MISPQITTLPEKKLVGMKLSMSLVNNKTAELWKNFMPFRKDISNKVSADLISMQIYDSSYFVNFNPNNVFEKWATVEVANFDEVPENMESFVLPSGLYAVFHHIGSSNDNSIFQHIFGTWLPNSNFLLDQRPHFEILGEKYKNNDPNSEEEIWIPIREIKK